MDKDEMAQERRDALSDPGPCYRHHYLPDGRGGGRCACGATVHVSEL